MVDKQGHSLRRFQWAALGIVLRTIAIRLPSLVHPQPIDSEGIYSVVANEMVDGGRPYIDAVERKPPLLFWTYAAIFRATGKFNWVALHFVALAWTLCAMVAFMIGSGLFDRNTGLIAALFYGISNTGARKTCRGRMLMNLLSSGRAIAFRRSYSRLRPELWRQERS
jgi:hypothetical protein